jgi:flagellar biosynthetic protein FliR
VHRVLLGSVLASFRVLPPGTVVDSGRFAPSLVTLSAAALESGIRIALPLLGALFVSQVALAFISRAAPAMQIFSVGFAVTLSVGCLILVMVLPDIAHEMASELSRVGPEIDDLLVSLVPKGP